MKSACALVLAIVAFFAAPFAAAQSPDPAEGAFDDGASQAATAEPSVLFHLTGYVDATVVNTRDDGTSGTVNLAPIFHMQIADRFLLETELELEVDDRGNRATAVEYATVSWLLNDNAALVAGKFLSPVGYFFQNLHPSWVNKIASAPAGFGHGGAAPLSDVGLQLRGGKSFAGGQAVNYALYVANGPSLGLEDEEDLDLDAEGSTHNPDGKRVAGGRFGWLPTPQLELGVSLTRGKVILDAGETATGTEPSRTYRVEGLDMAWHPDKAVEVRGEWIRQRVGEATASSVPDGARWRAWYLQGAYRFGSDHWEAVLRRGDSVSPHPEATFTQTAVGLNYLFDSRTQLKLSWEFNDSAHAEANADRLLLQFAYGF